MGGIFDLFNVEVNVKFIENGKCYMYRPKMPEMYTIFKVDFKSVNAFLSYGSTNTYVDIMMSHKIEILMNPLEISIKPSVYERFDENSFFIEIDNTVFDMIYNKIREVPELIKGTKETAQ